MVSFASGDVTRLIEKIENEPMLEVKVTQSGPLLQASQEEGSRDRCGDSCFTQQVDDEEE